MAVPESRRGRPPATSPRELEVIALDLFARHGYDHTTVDEIASAAGVSKRTFFRYFAAKADVLWNAFDTEVDQLRLALSDSGPDIPVMTAVHDAVLRVNHYGVGDVPELRTRMQLVATVPELGATALAHYDAWEQAIIDFVANRTGRPAASLYPLTVGRATLAACRAAYEQWLVLADADLTVYLDEALRALATGFADEILYPRGSRVSPA